MENTPVEFFPEPGTQTKEKPRLLSLFSEVFETLLIALILFLAINAVTARIRVDGSSMEPSLHHNELIMVNRLAYKLGEPALADVVVFRFPRDPEQEYIKRIIGVPGDTVEIIDHQVFVNGFLIDEPYIAAPTNQSGVWTVPEGRYFVLGDNRNDSSDSRTWGTVPEEYVIGKAIFVYWPPEDWGLIAHAKSLDPDTGDIQK
ncbi:MAG: signal peptidase I [Chloroflexi bacterium]|nr:MAG: signal peptidase I [Chloroflexota bacterium]